MRALFSYVFGLFLSVGTLAMIIWFSVERQDAILVIAGVLAGFTAAWVVGGLFDALLGRRR